jgi:hypothetical protein
MNYKRTQLSYIDISSGIPVIALSLVSFLTRTNLENVFSSMYFSIAMAFTILTVIISTTNLIMLMIVLYSKSATAKICAKFIDSKVSTYSVEFANTVSSIATGLFLYARVVAGDCESRTNIWESQMCNPVASANSIPHDQVMLCYLLPILLQLTFKRTSIRVAILQWVISTIFVIVSIAHVNGWLQLWTIVYSVFFLCISCEIERFFRSSFLLHQHALELQARVRHP